MYIMYDFHHATQRKQTGLNPRMTDLTAILPRPLTLWITSDL